MSAPTHNRSLAQADALYESEVDAQWRLWRCYLDAQQILLTAQDAATTPMAFEGADSLAAQARQAQADLDRLPATRRVLFDAVVAQYRGRITEQHEARHRATGGHGPDVDVDVVDREVLDTLRLGAVGTSTADGRGLVPMSRNAQDEIVWYSVDAALLTSVPTQTTYGVGQVSRRETTLRVLGILTVLVGMLLFGIVWVVWILPGGSSELAMIKTPGPQVNDQPVSVWPLTALVVTDASNQEITVPVQTRTMLPPQSETARTPTAFWSTTDVWPLALCVAGDESLTDLSTITHVRLRGSGETPDRLYTLQAIRPVVPDLLLTMCAERVGDDHVQYGVLQRTEALPVFEPGEAATIDASTTITLESIQGIGPGEDASVPDNQQQVVVTVSGATSLDWPHATATLLVADGQRIVTPDIQPDGDRTVLRYGVTLMTMPTEVAWQITHPATGRVVRWRTTLSPPPDRATMLAQNLVVADITADLVATGEPVPLHLILSNRGSQPLILTPDDIVLMQGDVRLATSASAVRRAALFYDLFANNQAAHSVILGKTGYGKTYFLNVMTLRAAALAGYRIIGMDAFRNGYRIATAIGAGAICHPIGAQSVVNILDVVFDEHTEGGWIPNQVQHVIGQLALLLGTPTRSASGKEQYTPRLFTNPERGVLDRALTAIYATLDPAAPLDEMPILTDLIAVLDDMAAQEAQALAYELCMTLFGDTHEGARPNVIDLSTILGCTDTQFCQWCAR